MEAVDQTIKLSRRLTCTPAQNQQLALRSSVLLFFNFELIANLPATTLSETLALTCRLFIAK